MLPLLWSAMIRPASLHDLAALVALEQRCFHTDLLSRRSFRHLLMRGHAATLVDERDGVLAGYVLVLFRRGVSMARIYSIATDPDFRGQGVAAALVGAAEQAALEEGAVEMRLEVRQDNPASQGLFRRLGYRPCGVHAGYYEDSMDAVRYHRYLITRDEFDRTARFGCSGQQAVLIVHGRRQRKRRPRNG